MLLPKQARRPLTPGECGEGTASIYTARDPGQGLGTHEEAAILDIEKQHPLMGPAQIRAQLKRFHGWRVAVKAIARVLRAHGYELVRRGSRPSGPNRRSARAPLLRIANGSWRDHSMSCEWAMADAVVNGFGEALSPPPMSFSHTHPALPTTILALVSLGIARRLRPGWIAVTIEDAAAGEGVSSERMSRLVTRAIDAFAPVLARLTQRGRPRSMPSCGATLPSSLGRGPCSRSQPPFSRGFRCAAASSATTSLAPGGVCPPSMA